MRDGPRAHSASAAALTLVALTSACVGTVYMTPMDPKDVSSLYNNCVYHDPAKNQSDGEAATNGPEACGKRVEGIIVYRPVQLVEVDYLTQIGTSSGKSGPEVISSDCHQVAQRKIVSVPDTEHPYLIQYDHGILEGYVFNVTLNSDGILLGTNTTSTPDQGKTLDNLLSAATSAAKLPFLAYTVTGPSPKPGEKKKPCTMTPVFVGYERPPTHSDIPKLGTFQPPPE